MNISVTLHKIYFLPLFILTFLIGSGKVFSQETGTIPLMAPLPIVSTQGLMGNILILVDKAEHIARIYNPLTQKIEKEIKIATGKKRGNKIFSGDFRTPEGIYFIESYIGHQELLKKFGEKGKIYGNGAYTLNFPNSFDKLANKSGSGIWLHSTNDETRIEKGLDSRGCVVMANQDLLNLENFIHFENTLVSIQEHQTYITSKQATSLESEIKLMLEKWRESWEKNQYNDYISHYSENFSHSNYGKISQFKAHKKNVFQQNFSPSVQMEHLSFVANESMAIVRFKQVYQAKNLNDSGLKTLYLIRDEYYQWKILSEEWEKWSPERLAKNSFHKN